MNLIWTGKQGNDMSSKSLTDIAYEKLSRRKKEVFFPKLWKEVSEDAQMSEELAKKRVASFYNALMMDSRFISLEGNKWDLRQRHTLESLMIDPDLIDEREDEANYDDFDPIQTTEED